MIEKQDCKFFYFTLYLCFRFPYLSSSSLLAIAVKACDEIDSILCLYASIHFTIYYTSLYIDPAVGSPPATPFPSPVAPLPHWFSLRSCTIKP